MLPQVQTFYFNLWMLSVLIFLSLIYLAIHLSINISNYLISILLSSYYSQTYRCERRGWWICWWPWRGPGCYSPVQQPKQLNLASLVTSEKLNTYVTIEEYYTPDVYWPRQITSTQAYFCPNTYLAPTSYMPVLKLFVWARYLGKCVLAR